MTDQGEERAIRLASIVSLDIVGFSKMSERDQRNAARKVESLRARVERVAAANGGRLFNTAGDGFMLEFASAGSALGAIQELLDKRPRGEPLVRVGAHVGLTWKSVNRTLSAQNRSTAGVFTIGLPWHAQSPQPMSSDRTESLTFR